MVIGQKIRNIREAYGWKQEVLAEKSGLTRASIGNYERGDRIPPADAAKRIADALNTSVDRLVNNEFGDYLAELFKNSYKVNAMDSETLSSFADLIGLADEFAIERYIDGEDLPSVEEIKELAGWLGDNIQEGAYIKEKMMYAAGFTLDPIAENETLDELDLEHVLKSPSLRLDKVELNNKEVKAINSFLKILKDFRN